MDYPITSTIGSLDRQSRAGGSWTTGDSRGNFLWSTEMFLNDSQTVIIMVFNILLQEPLKIYDLWL